MFSCGPDFSKMVGSTVFDFDASTIKPKDPVGKIEYCRVVYENGERRLKFTEEGKMIRPKE